MVAAQDIDWSVNKISDTLPNFPVNTVRAAIAAMLIVLCTATYFTIRIGTELRDGMRAQIEVLSAAERLRHHGEVLELSIRSVATYGDAAAAARYRRVQPRLRATLNELRDEVRLETNKQTAIEVERADLALVMMEQEALDRASEGNLAEARNIVNSARYDRLLNIYTDGIKAIEKRSEAYVASTDAKLDWYLSANLALTVAGFGLIILGWLAILRPAKLWGKRLKDAHATAKNTSARLAQSEAELQVLNVKLAEQARIDTLTKLQTRLKLNEDLDQLWPRVERYSARYCAIMCDIDNFKQYNDTYGHIGGDDVLRRVADALSSVCRGGDQIYRFGGEEFLILLPECSLEGGSTSAERYRKAVEALAIPHSGGPSGLVTASMGVAHLEPGTGATIDGWLGEADAALYKAKRAGKNRVIGSQPARA